MLRHSVGAFPRAKLFVTFFGESATDTDAGWTGLYCFGNGGASVINEGAGFGGPGRSRLKGTNVVNVPGRDAPGG